MYHVRIIDMGQLIYLSLVVLLELQRVHNSLRGNKQNVISANIDIHYTHSAFVNIMHLHENLGVAISYV